MLLGPSGCGKSTLLNIIAGLEEITDGEVVIGDQVANDLHPRDRDIAMVFQSYALYPSMSVRRNMAFGLSMRGVDKDAQRVAVERVADLLGITHLLDRRPAELSGGQRQRVAMGRALVRDPGLFLFDEPLSNLDAKLRVQMRSEIKKLHNRLKTTIVYVTHDQVEAMTLATTVAVMRDGEIQQNAPPAEIYDRPSSLFVAGFVGSPQMNFLKGRISGAGTGAVIELLEGDGSKAATIPLIPEMTNHPELSEDRPVVVGIRPETFHVQDRTAIDHGFDVQIELVEITGADTIVSFSIAGQEAAARLSAEIKPALGDNLRLSFDLRRIHLFDRETGKRIN